MWICVASTVSEEGKACLTSMDTSGSKLWKTVMDREAWRAQPMGSHRVGHDWVTEQQPLALSWNLWSLPQFWGKPSWATGPWSFNTNTMVLSTQPWPSKLTENSDQCLRGVSYVYMPHSRPRRKRVWTAFTTGLRTESNCTASCKCGSLGGTVSFIRGAGLRPVGSLNAGACPWFLPRCSVLVSRGERVGYK